MSSRAVGIVAVLAGLAAAGYLTITSVLPYLFSDSGTLAAENAPISLFWSVVIVGLSFGAGYGLWKQKLMGLWIIAVISLVGSVLALFSFGVVIMPFAVLLLVTAILMTIDQRWSVAE